MTIARIHSAGLYGIEARRVTVEVDIAKGLPGWHLVGLAEAMVRESKERVTAAIRNAGFHLANRKTTINLAPARERKSGTWFELPIAIGLLEAAGLLPSGASRPWLLVGELSLAGTLQPVPGAFAAAVLARRTGYGLIHPAGNAAEMQILSDLKRIAAHSLAEVVTFLREGIRPADPPLAEAPACTQCADLDEVRGQAGGRRAVEIAAAGGHHLFFLGPPGTGKTMLAERLPGILPPLTEEEAIEIAQIYSVMEAPLAGDALPTRPFRSPHHTATAVSLTGGGRVLQAGEITMAHRGVLFLDELGEFHRDALEVLRQPLENGVIHITRADYRTRFPARFVLVAAANPCRCGHFGHPTLACECSLPQIQHYRRKLSGPLMDRIDLHVELGWMPPEEVMHSPAGEPSRVVRDRVLGARHVQAGRYRGMAHRTNGTLSARMVRQWCEPTPEAARLLYRAIERHGLSARAHDRILRVARTIADLAGEAAIGPPHMAEALQYRALDRPL